MHGLGITVYEALTGQLPFPEASTHAELLQRQLNQPIPAVRASRHDVPGAVDQVLARATAKAPQDRFERIEDFVTEFVAALDSGTAHPSPARRAASTMMAALDARNPYKGLRAFTEADAVDFRGRGRLVDRLVANLSRTDTSGRVAMVVGPSGIGKSSVVRAGLLPALRRGAVPGSENWFVATMLPGRDPFEELGAALLRVATKAPDNLMGQLADNQRGLARVVKAVLPDDGHGAVLLVIDQFEELFTLCEDEIVRRRFLDTLEYALTDARCPLRVVATIRADFYDRPLRHGSFARLIEPSTIAVTALAPDELEAAIVEPAAAVGCEFEPGLVSEIVADVGDQPGALPLLQYALTELYERRVSELFTRDAYREFGGVAGALASRAEELTAGAGSEELQALRRVFGRLVALGEGTEDTRRRVLVSELGEAAATAAVIQRFGEARLLSFDRDPASREPTVEVAHEALIRRWPRLRGWLEEDRDSLRVHRHLMETARSWDRGGRDDGELYRGARLEMALDWRSSHQADPNTVEREFLDTSRTTFEAARWREVRARRRLRRAFAAVVVVALLAMVAGGLAFQQRGTARAAADTARDAAFAAETGRLAALAPTLAETDLSLSMLLGVEAMRRADTPESLGALQRSFVAADTSLGFLFSDEPLRAVFVDGDRIVGFGESSITRWDATTRQRIDMIPLGTPVRDRGALSWHPVSYANGTVAWVGTDHVARWFKLSQPAAVQTVAAEAADVALDPAGTRAAVALRDGGVALVERNVAGPRWAVPADGIRTIGEAGLTLDLTPVPGMRDIGVDTYLSQVAFSPDGSTVLHTRAGWLNWLDAATGTRHERTETVYFPIPDRVTNQFKAFTFDQQRGQMYLAGVNSVGAYDLADRTVVTRYVPPVRNSGGNAITALASLTEGSLAVLTSTGDLTVVDVGNGSVGSETVDARVGRGAGLAVLSDGTTLLVAGERGVAFIATGGGGLLRQAVPYPAGQPVLSATRNGAWVSAEAQNLASVSQTTPIRYWRCVPDGGCESAEALPWVQNTMTYPDVWSNTWVRLRIIPFTDVQVFDAATSQPLSPMIQLAIPGGFGGNVVAPADRSWIAVSRRHVDSSVVPPGVVQVNAMPSGERIATIESGPGVVFAMPPSEAVVLAFSSESGESFLIDTATWTSTPSPLGAGAVVAAAYSQDGRWLVTSDTAGALVVRDPATFAELRRMSSEAGSSRGGFAFSDDGRYLVSTQDGKGRLWEVESGELVGQPIGGMPTVSPAAFPGPVPGFVTVDATEKHLQLWRFDPSTWLDIACRAAGRNLTRAEWEQYGPRDSEYRATCAQWPVEA